MTRLPITALSALALFLPLVLPTSSASTSPSASSLGAPAGASAPQSPDSASDPGELVQIRISGELAAPPPGDMTGTFGHLVEVEIDAVAANSVASSVVLHVHLAAGTRGSELLQLVAAKLSAASMSAHLALANGMAPDGSSGRGGSLWVERATRVHLRLGGGLEGEIACAEGPPAAIRVLPASALAFPATAMIAASTAIVMKDRPPLRGRATFRARLENEEHAAQAATALWKGATDQWVSDRPGADAWRPIKMSSGAAITGVSIRLTGRSDRALQVTL